MLMLCIHQQKKRKGAAAVEMALVMPLVTILLLGIWEVGRLLEVNNILHNAVREGGRRASSGYFSSAECQQVVIDYVQSAGLPVTGLTVTVQNLTSPGVDPKQAVQMDEYRVHATMPFNNLRWIGLDLVTSSSTMLNAESRWFSLRDREYPTIGDPPIE